MKNIFKLLSIALVGSTIFVGCQKEEAGRMTITFENMNSPKSYIYNDYNCWENGESLFINGTSKTVTVQSSTNSPVSYVSGVTSTEFGNKLFCFFGGTMNGNDVNYTASDNSYTFTVPSTMTYSTVNGKQKIDAPVAGFTSINENGIVSRLSMKNIGSMLHFTFVNTSTLHLWIDSVKVNTNNTPISGQASVIVPETNNPSSYTITPNNPADFSKKIVFPNNILGALTTKSVYFPIATLGIDNNIIFEIYFIWAEKKWKLSYTKTNGQIAQNEIMSLSHIQFNYDSNGTGNDLIHYTISIGTTTLNFKNKLSDNGWTLQQLN